MKPYANNCKNLVLLVGGLGTRLREVVSDVPKPMAPIKSKPFLEYILKYWVDKGIKNFHLLVGYKGSLIENYFGDKFFDSNIFYYYEEFQAGTGGAIKLFLRDNKVIGNEENFILMNGDTWLDIDLNQLNFDYFKSQNNILIAVKKILMNDRYGALEIKDGYVIKIQSYNNKASTINSGLYIINIDIISKYLNKQKEYKFSFEEKILPLLINEKKLKPSYCVKQFLDIGIPSDYIKAESIVKIIDIEKEIR